MIRASIATAALTVALLLTACVAEDDTATVDEVVLTDEAALSIAGPRRPPAIPWDEMTALQRHVAFFDYDGDGYITVLEDYRGLRALGIWPVPAATFINGLLATPTRGFPSLTIDLRNIAAGIHGSDTGIYDSQGRFVPEVFERLFTDWDRNGSGGLDPIELAARTAGDADLWDVFGVAVSAAEFGLLFFIAQEDGELSRARMRAFYDGTLFYVLAGEAPPR